MINNPNYKKYDIGIYTYGKPKILDWKQGTNLHIGKFCSIAADVKIFLGGNHRHDWITTFPLNQFFENFTDIKGHPSTKGDVTIGNDIYIGNGAVILSGVKIGDGAVVRANSVVCKNIEPYSIVVGNPAKEIKKRFDKDTINKLLKIKWWNWDINKIQDNIRLLQSKNIETFITKHM